MENLIEVNLNDFSVMMSLLNSTSHVARRKVENVKYDPLRFLITLSPILAKKWVDIAITEYETTFPENCKKVNATLIEKCLAVYGYRHKDKLQRYDGWPYGEITIPLQKLANNPTGSCGDLEKYRPIIFLNYFQTHNWDWWVSGAFEEYEMLPKSEKFQENNPSSLDICLKIYTLRLARGDTPNMSELTRLRKIHEDYIVRYGRPFPYLTI